MIDSSVYGLPWPAIILIIVLSIAQSAAFVNYLSGRMAEWRSTAVGSMIKFQIYILDTL